MGERWINRVRPDFCGFAFTAATLVALWWVCLPFRTGRAAWLSDARAVVAAVGNACA